MTEALIDRVGTRAHMKSRRPAILAIAWTILAMAACGCASSNASDDAARPIVWTLDSTTNLGGHSVETLGSPRVVIDAGRRAVCFDGASDALLIDHNPIADWPQFTVEAWIKPDAQGPEEQRFLHVQDERDSRLLLETRHAEGQWALDTFLFVSQDVKLTLLDREKRHPSERWHWVALSFEGRRMTHYVNGRKELEGEVAFQPMASGRMSIGVRLNRVSWYKGCIGEIRFTPKALSEDSLRQHRDT